MLLGCACIFSAGLPKRSEDFRLKITAFGGAGLKLAQPRKIKLKIFAEKITAS